MNNVYVNTKNWTKYINAVQDNNPIHTNKKAAQGYGLNDIIAPGMYIASFVQLKMPGLTSIDKISFKKPSFNKDTLDIKEELLGNKVHYQIIRENEIICNIKGTTSEHKIAENVVRNISHKYLTELTNTNTKLYLESLGAQSTREIPSMYLASLSASALSDYASKNSTAGIHLSQGFALHEKPQYGELEILIGDSKERRGLTSFNLNWIQNGKILASGISVIAELKK